MSSPVFPRPTLHLQRTHAALSAYLIVVALAAWGCGLDEDALICAEGRRIGADGQCEDRPEPQPGLLECLDAEPSAPPEPSADATEDSRCLTWRDCPETMFCDAIDAAGFGRCALRCDDAAASPCANDAYCSASGVCLPDGGAGAEGAACQSITDCAQDLTCAAESARCLRICDPRAPGCPDSRACLVRDSGLGFCVTLCN